MSETVLPVALLLGAGILVVSVFAVRFAGRIGVPGLLFFLAFGLVLETTTGVSINSPALAQSLGLGGLVVILAEGGLTTSWAHVRRAMPAATVLATVGVGASMFVVGAAAHYLVGLGWQPALLLGAIVSSTDAAAVFSVLRRLPLPPRLSGILEAESGLNDAPGVILVVSFSTAETLDGLHIIGEVLLELAIGGAIGFAIGWLGAQLLRRLALTVSGLHSLTVLGLIVGAYGVAVVSHGSGFLAVYVAGVVLGNARLPHRPATRGFAEGMGWLAQIGLFVMLGVTAFPDQLPGAVVPAFLVGIGLLVARPVSVLVSLVWFRLPWRDHAFLSWAGLRGAVPIVLATIPGTTGLAGSSKLFHIVFVLVVIFTLLQAPTLPLVAKRLRVTSPAEPRDLDVEAAPLEDMNAELLQVRISRGSELAGIELFELRLPAGAAVTLVVRSGDGFVPEPTTVLRPGDELLVISTPAARDLAERRIRAVHRRGKLAGWLGDRGEPNGEGGDRGNPPSQA